MQIIAGKHRGRKIETVPSLAVRPTLGRTRESVFNILQHWRHGDGTSPILDARVADLYCGSGAFGLEALSRGAAHVTFVDHAEKVLSLARANAERFGETETTRFLRTDATNLPHASQPYALIFLDPPYHERVIAQTLQSLLNQGWVNESTVLIVELPERDTIELPPPLTVLDERRYGKTKILFLRKLDGIG